MSFSLSMGFLKNTDSKVKDLYLSELWIWFLLSAGISYYFITLGYPKTYALCSVAIFLVWPQIVLGLGIFFSHFKGNTLLFIVYSIDALLAGILLGFAHFNLAMLALITLVVFSTSLETLGLIFAPLLLVFFGLGISIGGSVEGFQYNPRIALAQGIVILPLMMAFTILFYKKAYVLVVRIRKVLGSYRQKNKDIQIIVETLQQSCDSYDMQETFFLIVEQTKKLLSYDYLIIYFLNEEKNFLELAYIYNENVGGDHKKFVGEKTPITAQNSIVTKIYREQHYFYSDDILSEVDLSAQDSQLLNITPFSAVLGYPLILGKKHIGVILFLKNASTFSLEDDDLQTLDDFSKELSLILYNKLLYQKTSEEKERLDEASDQLKQIYSQLSKYIPAQIYPLITQGKSDVDLTPRSRILTVMIIGISDFEKKSAKLEPEVTAAVLNDFFSHVVNAAQEYSGTIDRFLGDKAIIIFGAPETKGEEQDAYNSIQVAIKIQKIISQAQKKWMHQFGLAESFQLKIAIHTGECLVGNFKSDERMIYTAVGNPVLCTHLIYDNIESGDVVITEEVRQLIKGKAEEVVYKTIEVKEAEITLNLYHLGIRTDLLFHI